MQIFLESANLDEIRTASEYGFIDGVVTSPNLLASQNTSYLELANQLFSIIDGLIFLDVAATNYPDIVSQAKQLSALDRRVIAQVPCTSDGLRASKTLATEGIKICVNHVFSLAQAILVAKSSAQYASCSVGQLDHASDYQVEELLAQIRNGYDESGSHTKIISNHIKDVVQFEEMVSIGVDAVVIPFHVIEKISKHRLTDQELQRSIDNWQKLRLELPK